MIKLNCILLFLFYCFSIAQEKMSIAVLELDAVGLSKQEAQVLTDRLRTELFKTNQFKVLERDKMTEILDEQGFQLSGCTTNDCVVDWGLATGTTFEYKFIRHVGIDIKMQLLVILVFYIHIFQKCYH